jgi:hypothetical protein
MVACGEDAMSVDTVLKVNQTRSRDEKPQTCADVKRLILRDSGRSAR